MGPEDHKAAFLAQYARDGNKVRPLPDGPVMPYFAALELAQAIEREITRTASTGGTKLRLDMDLNNAQELATYLRRAVLAGV